jgi:hypothetical protein
LPESFESDRGVAEAGRCLTVPVRGADSERPDGRDTADERAFDEQLSGVANTLGGLLESLLRGSWQVGVAIGRGWLVLR